MVSYIPPSHRDRVLGKLGDVATVLKNFMIGQLTVAVIMGALYSLGLSIVGIDFAPLIGFASGLLNIVPYLGLIIGLLLSSTVSLIQFRDIYHLLGVVGVYLAVQFIEGLWLSPKILGTRMGLHPIVVIVSILIGGKLFGFLGILLAVPAAAAISVFSRDLLSTYR